MKFNLAFVTGASSGIGEDLCRLLAIQGIDLVITGRNVANLKKLSDELSLKVKVTTIAADLSIPSERQNIINSIHDLAPDLVINNAGFGLYGPALTHTTDSQLEILNVNGTAVLAITLEAARTLETKKKKGVIVNVSSAASFQIFPELAVYASVKTFVTHCSQALDIELKPRGIRVLAACPGMVSTDFSRRAANGAEKQSRQFAISAQEAAQHIWDQINAENPVYIFGWTTRWATYLTHFLPQCLTTKILRDNISSRIPQRPFIPIE